MEKVVISKEIAEAIESRLFYLDTKEVLLVKHVNRIANGKQWQNSKLLPLNDISIEDLAKALYVGYEVEPEKPKFQTGDKVVNNDGSPLCENLMIGTITAFDVFGLSFLEEVSGAFAGLKFRHATPEEIYWLETLGREKVGQLKEGDVVAYAHSEPIEIRISDTWGQLEMKNATGIYPAEAFTPFPKEESK